MNRNVLLAALACTLLLGGCTANTVEYQCTDGTLVESFGDCPLVNLSQPTCPELDCAECPIKTETVVKTEKAYVCIDGSTVKQDTECFTADNLIVESVGTDQFFTSLDKQTIGSITITGILENKGPKEVVDYNVVGYLKKDGKIVASSGMDETKAEWQLSHDFNVSIRPGEKRAFQLIIRQKADYDDVEAQVTYKTK